MTGNEWKTGMELLLVYWMTAVDVSILRAVASASQNEATNGKGQILYLPTHACADLKIHFYKQKVLTGGLGTVYTAYSCCLFYVGRQTACSDVATGFLHLL